VAGFQSTAGVVAAWDEVGQQLAAHGADGEVVVLETAEDGPVALE
jgi:hypothetical protein